MNKILEDAIYSINRSTPSKESDVDYVARMKKELQKADTHIKTLEQKLIEAVEVMNDWDKKPYGWAANKFQSQNKELLEKIKEGE